MRILVVSLILCLLVSCNQDKKSIVEVSKAEILQTEKDFSKLSEEKGIAAAFTFYAADSAVILRKGNSLIKGKSEIQDNYDKPEWKVAKLQWKANFVDVAASGDLGYTYGNYTFISMDSLGKPIEKHGIFHTVWKKQEDGSWKFVWD